MTNEQVASAQESQLERGTFEIVRDRLLVQAEALGEKTTQLNHKRLTIFGGTEMGVLGSERIRTENNCVPRDIIEVAGLLLFGYNVFIGLRSEIKVSDALSLHRFIETDDGYEFPAVEPGTEEYFLDDPAFLRDFHELFHYYKDTSLLQLRRVESKLLAVFKVGERLTDIRVFRWEVRVDGTVKYIDNRGERDAVFPPQYDFEWTEVTRDHYVHGTYPHVSILDEVFVETVAGDLTIKIENNTEDGLGIYSEPVDDVDQSLDDAEYAYAKIGSLILIRVLPYREETTRYLVFNIRTKTVWRLDSIGLACVQLPEDHGIIFPGGYYLREGETKSFDHDVRGMEFMKMIKSPNGEDVIYIFHSRAEGRTLLFPYNMIRKEVANPLSCHGYSRFDDGRIVIFSASSAEATRVHPVQIWRTPYVSSTHEAKKEATGSHLEKVGNADLVRGISDALGIHRLVRNQEPRREIYEDLIKSCTRMIDAYYWLGHDEIGLLDTVKEIQVTGEQIIDEFVKVEALRHQADQSTEETSDSIDEIIRKARPDTWQTIEDYVATLGELRSKRGHVISLREMRYTSDERLAEIENRVIEAFDDVSRATLDFLVKEESLDPFRERAGTIEQGIPSIEKVVDAEAQLDSVEQVVTSLNILIDILDSIEIDDATVRIDLLDRISSIMGDLNRLRATVSGRRKELLSKEGVAEFGVQFNLLEQNMTNALSRAESPESCDTELSKLLLMLENLETRFGELEDFLERLATKREEIFEAFSARRQSLLDAQHRRADQLMSAAKRILEGIVRRAETFSEIDALNAFFASDPMVEKLRDTAGKLRGLGDVVRADEIEGQLKSERGDAARSLRDRADIFEEGASIIRFGSHRFSVNNQKLELTMLPREGRMDLHLTGTSFFQAIDDPGLKASKDLWLDTHVSESDDVYRGEYLATSILQAAERGEEGLSIENLTKAAVGREDLVKLVRDFAKTRYDEGYERGVHDEDGARILGAILGMLQTGGLLRYTPQARAAASLYWHGLDDRDRRSAIERQAQSLVRLKNSFASRGAADALCIELQDSIATYLEENSVGLSADQIHGAGAYLVEEIGSDPKRLILSGDAAALIEAFNAGIRKEGNDSAFREDLRALGSEVSRKWNVALSWLLAFLDGSPDEHVANTRPALEEAAAALITPDITRDRSSAVVETDVAGLVGGHPRVVNGSLHVRLDEILARTGSFREERVPAFRSFQKTRHSILEKHRKTLRLSELEPHVMNAFVRNKLINDVYLPLVGANLAKQMGTAGEGKRTDLMGLLLLVSPPGYGKTTLMEYIANRLGLVFLKINGPALGHAVTSLDPADAPNATARQEINKLNLAFEMGNNVMLYVDDIQHTNPEFLQKFISLCDAQRKIEGVWNGETRTYDLRGKRFCVCMAGNPYTESGAKFRIPDMLANRADVYNLGEVLAGKEDLFELSYLENALTSNPVTAPLLTRETDDVYMLAEMAKGEAVQPDQLKHDYSSVEINELMGVMRKLIDVQKLLSTINRLYISSAAQENAYRTEPPFRLQGSYRNMNKLAERIVPAMNDDELQRLIDDHYLGEAQTLTTGAEENLLKLAELRGAMNDEQMQRWEQICDGFRRVQRLGSDDDPASRLTGEISIVAEKLGDIGRTISEASSRSQTVTLEGTASAATPQQPATIQVDAPDMGPFIDKLDETLRALIELKASTPAEAMPDTNGVDKARLATRESFLIGNTLVPLVKFMAHRFKGYRGVKDPELKKFISKLEYVESFDDLVHSLELINEAMLASLTMDGKKKVES